MAEPQHVHHALDYVEFAVADTAASRVFYEAALGWQFHDYGPEYSGIVGGAGESGGLRRDDDAAAAAPVPGVYSEDLDASYASVRAAGGVVTVEPFAFPGGRRFQFRDPDGNELIVYSAD
jgi:predicted enzyme related to lactoylglutathione lyase